MTCKHVPKNICIFQGQLVSFEMQLVGENKEYRLGKGKLLLRDNTIQVLALGQDITLVAWQDIADRLSGVPIGTWIKVLATYTPEKFRGVLYDNFVVSNFVIV